MDKTQDRKLWEMKGFLIQFPHFFSVVCFYNIPTLCRMGYNPLTHSPASTHLFSSQNMYLQSNPLYHRRRFESVFYVFNFFIRPHLLLRPSAKRKMIHLLLFFSHSFTLVDFSLVGFCCCWFRLPFFSSLVLASRYVKNHVDLKSFFYCFIFKRSLQEKKKRANERINKIKRLCAEKKGKEATTTRAEKCQGGQ